MSAEIFITKYKAQLQALLPSSEVEYELQTENPIKFTDSENVKLAFACIAELILEFDVKTSAHQQKRQYVCYILLHA